MPQFIDFEPKLYSGLVWLGWPCYSRSALQYPCGSLKNLFCFDIRQGSSCPTK